MNIFDFTPDEIAGIMATAEEADAQMDALTEHYRETGTVVPLRTLGFGEEVALSQRLLILHERRRQHSPVMKLMNTYED